MIAEENSQEGTDLHPFSSAMLIQSLSYLTINPHTSFLSASMRRMAELLQQWDKEEKLQWAKQQGKPFPYLRGENTLDVPKTVAERGLKKFLSWDKDQNGFRHKCQYLLELNYSGNYNQLRNG